LAAPAFAPTARTRLATAAVSGRLASVVTPTLNGKGHARFAARPIDRPGGGAFVDFRF